MATLGGYLITLIARGPLSLQGTRGDPGAAPGWAAGAGAAGHVAAPKPTSAGRRGPELQFAWRRMDTRPALYLDLELVCGGTQSSGYQQWCSRTRASDSTWWAEGPASSTPTRTGLLQPGGPAVPEHRLRAKGRMGCNPFPGFESW
jgi:hypothetical protein